MNSHAKRPPAEAQSLQSEPHLVDAYWKVKRVSVDFSLAEAIRHHSQACGMVAYVYDLHPDRVAEAVAEAEKHRSGEACE